MFHGHVPLICTVSKPTQYDMACSVQYIMYRIIVTVLYCLCISLPPFSMLGNDFAASCGTIGRCACPIMCAVPCFVGKCIAIYRVLTVRSIFPMMLRSIKVNVMSLMCCGLQGLVAFGCCCALCGSCRASCSLAQDAASWPGEELKGPMDVNLAVEGIVVGVEGG
ncbi:unnamed protein product [Ostreobium quekettii]|uniref:Uncharacterized protein n=1 Tax=Ostreobium quekettii TaxID=121088 RepID=A0A8S1IJT7_9CHLO|nr:unnamed protein product [Ostreobium quekettii]